MGALFDLPDRADAQLLKGLVVELAPSSSRMRGLDQITTTMSSYL
jgi:hypothetical protein